MYMHILLFYYNFLKIECITLIHKNTESICIPSVYLTLIILMFFFVTFYCMNLKINLLIYISAIFSCIHLEK